MPWFADATSKPRAGAVYASAVTGPKSPGALNLVNEEGGIAMGSAENPR